MPSRVHCNWRMILDSGFDYGDILFHSRPCLRGPIEKLDIIKRQGEAVPETEWVQVTARWLAKKDPSDLLNDDVPWVYHEGQKLVLEFPNNSARWGYELIYPQDGSNVPTKIRVSNCSIFVGKTQLDPRQVVGFPS